VAGCQAAVIQAAIRKAGRNMKITGIVFKFIILLLSVTTAGVKIPKNWLFTNA
jgi:hypothetical protein